MNKRHWQKLTGLLVLVLLLASPVFAAPPAPNAALGSAFTYQGRLMEDDAPAAGPVDLRFTLHSHATDDVPVGTAQTVDDQTLVDGYFTVILNFGDVFDGTQLWLQVEVRPAAGGTWTPLTPRQTLTAAPQSAYALDAGSAPWSGISGLPGGFDDDVDNDTLGDLTSCLNGEGLAWNGSAWACQEYWSIDGNSGPAHVAGILGTTDNHRLHLIVNNVPALRIYPHDNSPNIIGGASVNSVSSGAYGAFIGGGGNDDGAHANAVGDRFSIVVGGMDNTAGIPDGNPDNASYAIVVGGQSNEASAPYASVGGGSLNEASGASSTVPGGMGNHAEGTYSFAAGFRAQALHDGTFVWADSTNTDFDSPGDDTFSARTSGGAVFYVGSNDFSVAETPPDATPPFSVRGNGNTQIHGSDGSNPALDVTNSAGRAIAAQSGTGSGIAVGAPPAILGDADVGIGVTGLSHGPIGVMGQTDAAEVDAVAVYGYNSQTAGYRNYGVMGKSEGSIGIGVGGFSDGSNGIGVHGEADGANAIGVRANNDDTDGVALDVTGSGIIRSSAETVYYANPLNAVVEARSDAELHPHVDGYVEIGATATGTHVVMIPIDLPGELYGEEMKVNRVKICYQCESSLSYIGNSTLYHLQTGDADIIADSSTNRTSTNWTCYTVSPGIPVAIGGSVFLRLDLTYTNTGHYIQIGEISVNLLQD